MTAVLGAGRVFASHYQFVLCEDPARPLADEENWNPAVIERGFAGAPDWRMIGTHADLNDHWVELAVAEAAPDQADWHIVTCCDFVTRSGAVHVMGVMDADPVMSAKVAPGTYSAFICGLNPGVDAVGAQVPTDAELAARDDVERYRVILVPGAPHRVGVLFDRNSGTASSR